MLTTKMWITFGKKKGMEKLTTEERRRRRFSESFRKEQVALAEKKKIGAPKKSFGHPKSCDFLVGQDYSLAGCSPAEPVSASSWAAKV
jgi:hypothetical protein